MSQLQVTGEAKIRDIQGPVVANSGVITALDGAASQYVRGDGTLADFPTSSGGGSSVSYYLNSSVSQGTIGGVAYRELSKDPIIGAGTDIPISANGYVASYITDVNDPDVTIVAGGNFNCEFYFSVSNDTGNPFTYAELYKYDGTTFTLLGSSVGVPEYINQGTIIAPYYFAIPVATAALALTDRLAIRIYVNVDGRTVTLHTENGHLCQVVTTLSKGMVSLNNLTDQSQFLTTGTAGTNFTIASSGDTHTFNLPVASATNTGKLSSTDWSTFNNKQAALSFTAPLDNTANTISIPVATSLVDGYLDNADWVKFNTAYNDSIISAAVTGTTTKTLTLNQQDGGTVTASWTDDNTDAVSSVFGRTGAVVAVSGDYTTDLVTEGTTNLYFTNTRSRSALSFTAGSGAYNSSTGVITIPTNTSQLTNGANFITLASLSAGAGISYNNTTGVIASTITQYTDALARAAISLTTTGTSGAATYNSTTGVFNIPNYTPDLSGYVTLATAQTISGAKTFSATLNGTNAVFTQSTAASVFVNSTSTASYSAFVFSENGIAKSYLEYINSAYTDANRRNYTEIFNNVGGVSIWTNNIKALDINTSQAATFSSSIAATSATFSNSISLSNNNVSPSGAGIYQGSNYIQIVSGTSGLSINNNANTVANLVLTNGGNLGLGLIPSAWANTFKVIQGPNSELFFTSRYPYIVSNGFFDTSWKYVNSEGASFYVQAAGQHQWFNAPTGTAGAALSFTQAMTLLSTGSLLLGTTTDNGSRLQVSGAATFSGTLSVGGTATLAQISLGVSTANTTSSKIAVYDNTGSNFWGIGLTNYSSVFGLGLFSGTTSTGTPQLIVNQNGNVGIGTTAPASFTNFTTLTINNATQGGVLQLQCNGTNALQLSSNTTDSYIYEFRNIPLIFATNATERMRITSGGNVGIGVVPSAWGSSYTALQMGSLSGLSMFAYTGGNEIGQNFYYDTSYKYATTGTASALVQSGGVFYFRNASSGSANAALTWTNAMTLDTSGSLSTSGSISIGTGGTYTTGSIYSDASWGMIFRAKQASPSNAQYRWANSADTELMRIAPNGNLLVNTPSGISGGGALQVNGNVNINGVFQINGTTIGGGGGSGVTGSGTTNYVTKWTGASTIGNSILFDNGTGVGIGTTSPSAPLHVLGGTGQLNPLILGITGTILYTTYRINTSTDIGYIGSGSGIFTTGSGNDFGLRAENNLVFGIGAVERFRISNAGNVLIGTVADNGYKINLNGSISYAFGFLSNFRGSGVGSDVLVGNDGSRFYIGGNTYVAGTFTTTSNISVTGSVTATGGFFDTSDSRLKIIVKDYEQPKGIENVAARMYVKNSRKELGYFAQDLQEILPSAVGQGDDGFLTLSYSQVHTAKIAYLEEKVAQLENLIKSLL